MDDRLSAKWCPLYGMSFPSGTKHCEIFDRELVDGKLIRSKRVRIHENQMGTRLNVNAEIESLDASDIMHFIV